MKIKLLSLILFIFVKFSIQMAFANSCNEYLGAEAYDGPFFERSSLDKLNLFTDPLELLISNDPGLNQITTTFHNLPQITYDHSDTTLSSKTKAKISKPDQNIFKVLDLKYIVLDSVASVERLLRAYKNAEQNNSLRELILAKQLMMNDPDYSLLFTDLGISLWKKNELKQWLSDYSINSLMPSMMEDYIYTKAQEIENGFISKDMALRVADELDKYKNFALENEDEIEIFNEGAEEDSLTFLYRSLFRHALLQKRVELLKAIGKKTALTSLDPVRQTFALQTLAFFPEFLYQTEKVTSLNMFSEFFVPEGGIIFTSASKRLEIEGSEYELVLKAQRWVDDTKTEGLMLILSINTSDEDVRLNAKDAVKITKYAYQKWFLLPEILKSTYKPKEKDLEIYLETTEDGSREITISSSHELGQNLLEPYLLFGLFNSF